MGTLAIRKLPEVMLHQPTRHVERFDDGLRRFVAQMVETMRHYPRCVGLAAPQVGSSQRVAVMDASRHPKGADHHGLIVLVNPTLEATEGHVVGREGCLSIPDFTANVRRATRIHVSAHDDQGRTRALRLSGFEAIVAQHEIDHLYGKLILDRVANLKTDVFRRKTYL